MMKVQQDVIANQVSAKMTDWFRGLANVPGVDYRGDPRVQRAKLPGHNAKPERMISRIDGRQHVTLMWATKGGSTTMSPAAHHAELFRSTGPGESVAKQLSRLAEVLELPGTLSDYHFAIQQSIENLWKLRRLDRSVLPEIERLCRLDISLIRAQPSTITVERDGRTEYFRVLAFSHLMDLYSQNGFLLEALAVAQQAARVGQDVDRAVRELQDRWAEVEAEYV